MGPKDQQLVVVLRIHPLSDAELEEGATVIAHKVRDQVVVLTDPGEDPEDPLRTHRSREKTFIFDTVFDQHVSQEDVYCATTRHLVEGVISRYNATAQGRPTLSMLGMDVEPGIYLQTLADLFQAIEEACDSTDYRVSMSYLEIMQLLTKGNRQRTQEPMATHRPSSRSHAVLQVTVCQRSSGADLVEEVHVGRLFMVDLAGLEQASQAPGCTPSKSPTCPPAPKLGAHPSSMHLLLTI
ncbi:hypothetical protein MC885_014866 [Smutsia gigantea]|nr:hypothetical protein MC885_014866 [Smutsia gigantea]